MPLAILIAIALACVTALMLDTAVAELRSGDTWYAESRALAAAETGTASALGARLDTTSWHVPAGTVLMRRVDVVPDSASIVIQSLGSRMARLTVSAVSGTGRLRAIAGRLIYVRITQSPDVPGEAMIVPIGSLSWVAIP